MRCCASMPAKSWTRLTGDRFLPAGPIPGSRFARGSPIPASEASLAKATFGAGALHMSLGDLDTARALFEKSLALSRELGDKRGMAASLNTLGIVAHQQGSYDTSRTLYE